MCFSGCLAVPSAHILNAPELYIDEGSRLQITCVVSPTPKPPEYIFWYHRGEVSSTTFYPQINQNQVQINQSQFQINQNQVQIIQSQFQINQSQFQINQSQFQINHTQFQINQTQFQINQSQFHINQTQFQINHTQFQINHTQFQISNVVAQLSESFNPLLPFVPELLKFRFKKEKAYESVDDRSLSKLANISKFNEKEVSGSL